MSYARFTVALHDRNFTLVTLPSDLQLTPAWYSADALGGMDQAEINLVGTDEGIWQALTWLRYWVVVTNPLGSPVWWGIVSEVAMSTGLVTVSLSLDEMANRVAVAYTTQQGSASVRGTTAWAEDSESVGEFGTKELLMSLSDGDQTAAEELRDTVLASLKNPVPGLGTGGDGTMSVVLRCRGLQHTLGWRYYQQTAGLEQHTAGSGERSLGLGVSDATIGFIDEGQRIWDGQGRLDAFAKDDRIRVSGSASNDGTYTVEEGTGAAREAVTSTGISFSGNRISDTNKGLAFLEKNQVINVSGSTSNDGWYRVEAGTNDGSYVDVVVSLTTEAAGASVTVSRGNAIKVDSALTYDLPGPTVTVRTANQAAQSFVPTANTGWTVAEAAVQLAKVGTPTDDLTLELRGDSSGLPGSLLESATIPAASVGTSMEWVTVSLSNTTTLLPSTTYWLVVKRTGADSTTDYYQIGVDNGASHSGLFKMHDGSGWFDPSPVADMQFQLRGSVETTTQLQDMLSTSNGGQFFTAVRMDASSGVFTNQYRNGDSTAWDEVKALLEMGTSNNRRLLLWTTVAREAVVSEEPARGTSSGDNLSLSLDGQLVLASTGRPLEEGVLPVARWVKLEALPPQDLFQDVREVFIERAQFDVEQGTLQLEPRGRVLAWDVGGVQAG